MRSLASVPLPVQIVCRNQRLSYVNEFVLQAIDINMLASLLFSPPITSGINYLEISQMFAAKVKSAIKLNLLGGFMIVWSHGSAYSVVCCLVLRVVNSVVHSSFQTCCPSQLMMVEVDDGLTVTTKDGDGMLQLLLIA